MTKKNIPMKRKWNIRSEASSFNTLESKYIEYWTIELWNGLDPMCMNSSIYLTFITIIIVLYYDGMKISSVWMTFSFLMQLVLFNFLKYIMENNTISTAVIMRQWIVIILRIISSLCAFKLLPLSWKVFIVHDMYSFIRIVKITQLNNFF